MDKLATRMSYMNVSGAMLPITEYSTDRGEHSELSFHVKGRYRTSFVSDGTLDFLKEGGATALFVLSIVNGNMMASGDAKVDGFRSCSCGEDISEYSCKLVSIDNLKNLDGE